jgi:hypothetical protein
MVWVSCSLGDQFYFMQLCCAWLLFIEEKNVTHE